jgi:hypothetical protein
MELDAEVPPFSTAELDQLVLELFDGVEIAKASDAGPAPPPQPRGIAVRRCPPPPPLARPANPPPRAARRASARSRRA